MREATVRTIGDDAPWPTPAGIRFHGIDVAMHEAVEDLLDRAFGYDRHQRTAYRLRERVAAAPALSLTALDGEDRLAGSLQTWPLELAGDDGGTVALWLVGPIAVDPDRRNLGIGRAMLAHALDAIDRTPHPALLIGDPGYYGPFGFDAARTAGWRVPGPVERHRLLLRADDAIALPAAGLLGPRRDA